MTPLARRGVLGLRLDLQAPITSGVGVRSVTPGGPADRAGLRAGDVIVRVDGVALDRPETLSQMRFRASWEVRVDVLRDGVSHALRVVPDGRPLESHVGASTHLGQIFRAGLALRTLLTLPDGVHRPPCVFFIAGYTPTSIEDASTDGPTGSLVRALVSRGIAVFRIEKRGCGDSEGDRPGDTSFEDEAGDLDAALTGLLDDPRVSRVCLLGHSLGALHAKALSAKHPRVREVVVYGGGVFTWSEYLVALARRRHALLAVDPVETDEVIRRMQRLHAGLFVAQTPLAEILRAHPELASLDGIGADGRLHQRCDAYWRSVEAVRVPALVRAMRARMLVMWGSADWLTFREEHTAMTDMAERWRPGEAAYVELDGADHAMCVRASMHDALVNAQPSALHPALADTLSAWLAG